MTNHHTGLTATEELYHNFPLHVRFSADDTAKYNLPYRNISRRSFERSEGHDGAIERTITSTMPSTAESTCQKIFLPRRSGELRFTPQQYYYAASKSGVIPSWASSS